MKKISVVDWYSSTEKSFRMACLNLSKRIGSPLEGYTFYVHIGGNTAAVQHNPQHNYIALHLPTMDTSKELTRTEADILSGYIWHEMAHVLYTDMKVKVPGNLHRLVNGLEDARIEQKLIASGLLPGVRDIFAGLAGYSMDKYRAAGKNSLPFGNVKQYPFALAMLGRGLLSGTVTGLPATPAALRSALIALQSARSTADVLRIAERLAAAPVDDPGDQGGDQGGDPGDQGSDQGGDPGDQGGDPGDQDGDPGDQDGDQGSDQDGDQGSDQGSDPGDQGSDPGDQGSDPGDQGSDPGDQGSDPGDPGNINDIINDIIRDHKGRDYHADILKSWGKPIKQRRYSQRQSPDWIAHNIANQDRRLAKYSNKLGSLRLAIRDMLRSPDKTGTRRNQIIGRMDRRALVGMATDRIDVMSKKWFEPGRNTVVHIAVDASGSMGGYANRTTNEIKSHLSADFCKIFTDTIQQAGCKCTVSIFSGNVFQIIKKGDRLRGTTAREAIANLSNTAMSSTDTMLGLIDGYNQLKDVQHANKLLIVITDGSDDHGPERVKETCRMITDRGVAILGIGIGGMDVTGQYPHSISIPGNVDLIDGALKEINHTLRQIAKR
jgi:hypothetical protein